MNAQRVPMKALLTATVAAFFLLSACGSDATTALEEVEEVATTEVAEEAAVVEEVPVTEAVEESSPAEVDPVLEKAVVGMTAAWGSADGDLAWDFDSERCRGGIAEAPEGYVAVVAGWGTDYSGATASNITAVVDGDRAAVSYDVHDGAGDFVAPYAGQPWVLADGGWFRDAC